MIIIKLGGSVITNKEKHLSPRKNSIEKIARSLKKLDEPVIVVHGGGSYGHYWSVKYNMHTKPANYNTYGISVVKNSMVELNKIILDVFLKNKLNPYCLPPTDFIFGSKPITKKIKEIEKIAKSGFIPITFGDALWFGKKKSYILSGDRIMSILSNILKPRLCIFVLNVDGLYSNPKTKKLIHELKNEKPLMLKSSKDVTGGMKRKVEEALKISNKGINVFFVNGNKPERIIDAVKRKKFHGTLFKGR